MVKDVCVQFNAGALLKSKQLNSYMNKTLP